MRDLVIHDQDLIVATHGRSFWILDDIGPLREAAGIMAHADTRLLGPPPRCSRGEVPERIRPFRPDEPAGRNPPAGAVIDYFLPQPAKSEVAIEIAGLPWRGSCGA